MRVEAARKSRSGATVILTHLINYKKKLSDNLFCCFEGDDIKYYLPRLERHCGYIQDKITHFTCNGKEEVIRLYGLVKASTDLDNTKILYFVDKDFDLPLQKPNADYIYETCSYSIENYYTTSSVFSRILKCEYFYREDDREYETLCQAFSERQTEFHSKSLLLNAFLACQRDAYNQGMSPRLLLDNFNISTIIPVIELDRVEANYDLESLYRLFPGAIRLSNEIIQRKMDLFLQLEKGEIFRGKFEIHFLFCIIDAISRQLNAPSSSFSKKPGYKLSISKKNIISELTQYAETKQSLISYLNSCNLSAITD